MHYFEIFTGTLLAIAGGTLLNRANSLLRLHDRATSWPSAPGVVIRSELREDTDSDGTSYRAELTCSYAAEGEYYTTSRHTEGMTFAQPEQSARALILAFPVGKAVKISYDPSNAETGILNTGKPQHAFVIRRISLVAVMAGVALAIFGILKGA